MSGHTGGPWIVQTACNGFVVRRLIGSIPSVIIASIERHGDDGATVATTVEANAHLIAAAPDLYDALKKAAEVLAAVTRLLEAEVRARGLVAGGPLTAQVNAALAKAEGRQ